MTDAKKQKIKKILGIVGNILIWIFVAFSILVTVLVFAAQGSEDGIPSLFGKSLITIESDSMEPVYYVGDLVFMEKIDDAAKKQLIKNDIITYHAPIDINGDGQIGDINTHRILDIDHEKGVIITKGDHELVKDNYTIGYNDVIGKCTEDGKWGGVGNVIAFLRSSLGFFLCIVLPLILFFIYELYNFISLLVSERNKNKPVSKETEEEIKRRAIEEYLKKQAEKESKADEAAEKAEETQTPENDGENADDNTQK